MGGNRAAASCSVRGLTACRWRTRVWAILAQVQDDGTIIIIGVSVEDSRCPPMPGVVRARALLGGWVIKPLGDGRSSHATYLVNTDLGVRGVVCGVCLPRDPTDGRVTGTVVVAGHDPDANRQAANGQAGAAGVHRSQGGQLQVCGV